MTRRSKLPRDVRYSGAADGVYVEWNGTPEGQVRTTYSRELAYSNEGEDSDGNTWQSTPFQGANGSCRWTEIVRLVVKYLKSAHG